MRKEIFGFILILSFTCIFLFSEVAKARRPMYGFYFVLPDAVEASPGEKIEIDAGVINIGWYWLHKFNLTVSGLPEGYKVKVTPDYFPHLRILRAWEPEKGVYRVPQKFKIEIEIPEDSVGVFLVEVKGKEHRSWRKLENSSTFILRVSMPPKLLLSDIQLPEKVEEFKPFNASLKVVNEGLVDTNVSLKLIVPEDWEVSPNDFDLVVPANSSAEIKFNVTPTNTTGEILAFATYSYRGKEFNLTKESPAIVPVTAPKPIPVEAPTGLMTLVDFFVENPIIAIIAAILVIIIVWNSWEIASYYFKKGKRRKVEEALEQPETSETPQMQVQ